MRATEILSDAFDRVHETLPSAVDGLDADELRWRLDGDANPVGWLAWHLTRVQDDHVAGVATALGITVEGREWRQVWEAEGYADRFALPYDRHAIGYGHTSEQVGAFEVNGPTPLLDYHDAVHRATVRLLERLTDDQLGEVVDDRWDPPVTAAARLVSVVGDTMQHLGQAAYLRGLLDRR